ncbi:SH3 domain-containing protein C23A1.17-like isoform X1 [Homarus americanus]|uniref:SH3 domain-containing protein C23A1.17-like isoform X1 n=1 Tax=Homarus americanus TaxID=6706 RepID=UPI001C479EC1|nr:SH3 domain-containing protein C23A1.17-like isoform X1 [Homarus americanus]XP_042230598.1 SH3 domain-containing protein C23A1.17-like isoform X1 [Homarus americanus]
MIIIDGRMSSVAGGASADTSTTTAVPASFIPLFVPPPPRQFPWENHKVTKTSSKASKSISLPGMETAQNPSVQIHPLPSSSSPPLPPPLESTSLTSPPPPDLPPPPDFYPSSSSPPPPPPPPSYLFPELSSEDLPPPPPPHLFLDVSHKPPPLYICSYDPPSPEIKSEYDPQLPPGFSTQTKHFPLSPQPPPVPPPPRPTPPPPPTPPVRQASRENLAIQTHPSNGDNTIAVSEGTAYTAPDESKVSRVPSNTTDEYFKHIQEGTSDDRPPSSIISSSTLTATFLQTPESGMSPLPPHALRVSPVSTDAITPSSQLTGTDDLTMTPTFSDLIYTPNFYDNSKDSTLDMDTPEATPQLSVTPGTPSFTPAEEAVSPVPTKSQTDYALSPQYGVGKHDSDSESERTDYLFSERSYLETLVGSNTATTTTAGQAQIFSPMSTEPTSLFSLPTDSDTISADFDSFAADTLSPTAEYDFLSADVETSSVDTHVTASVVGMNITSASPGISDTAYTTADSALGSATMSPAFTESCTITPLPTEYVTPMSTNPTTPIPSPVASSPLPYFDAYPSSEYVTSTLPSKSLSFSNMETPSTLTVSVMSSQDYSPYSESSSAERLVRCQTSDTTVVVNSKQSSEIMSLVPLTIPTSSSQHTLCHDSKQSVNTQNQNTILRSSDTVEKMKNKDESRVNEDEQNLSECKQEFKENKQISVTDQKDDMSVEHNKEESSAQEPGISEQKDGEKEQSRVENEPQVKNSCQKIKEATLDIVDDKCEKDTTMNQEVINKTDETEISDIQVKLSETMPKDATGDHEAMDVDASQDTGRTEGSNAISVATLKTEKVSQEQEVKSRDKISQNASQERTQEIYEMMEDVNGNISYVLEDKQEKCVEVLYEAEQESNVNGNTKSDNQNDNVEDVLIEKEKEPMEIIDDKNMKDIVKYTSGKQEGEAQNEDGCAITKEKLPVPTSLSAGNTPPRSPGTRWKRSSLPSSPTHYSTTPSQTFTISHATSSLSSKSRSVPSSPLPYMSASVGGSMSPKKMSPSPTLTSPSSTGVASPKRRPKAIPLSTSPKEALQLLDAVVVDLENMSADLPTSSYLKQDRLSNKVISSKYSDESTDIKSGEAFLHQQDKISGLESEIKSASSSENQVQEVADSSHTEEVNLESGSDSCQKHHVIISTDSETEIVGATEHTHTENSEVHNQTCVSSVNISLMAVPHDNRHNVRLSPPPPVVSKPSDGTCSVATVNSHSDLTTLPSVKPSSSSSDRLSSISEHSIANVTLSNACSDVSVSSFSSEHCVNNLEASTNTDAKGVIHKETLPEDETIQKNDLNTATSSDKKLLPEEGTKENSEVVDLGIHVNKSNTLTRSSVERVHVDYNCKSNHDNEEVILENSSSINDTKPIKSSDFPPSQSSSPLGSIVEDVAPPSSTSRAKTPPLPPPRSCVNTPRPAVGAPLPPPRQYMLIPINQPQSTQRRYSPPPAPPRSTSIRKSSPPPPPPPRSAIHTPSAKNEWIDFPPLPPPPPTCINTPSTPPPKLTPVPEESSTPSTPLPPTRPSPSNSLVGSSSKLHEARKTETSSYNTRSLTATLVTQDTSSELKISCDGDPPALPPPPEEDFEEDPPPPPPPPVESEDETVPPLPLPPPPPDALFCPPPPPPPPPRVKPTVPPLPSPPFVTYSSPESSVRRSTEPFPSHHKLSSNPCSIAPPSESETMSSDSSAMPPPASSESPTSEVPSIPPPPMPCLTSSAASPLVLPLPHSPTPHESKALLSTSPTPFAPLPPRAPSPIVSTTAAPKSPLITTTPYGKMVIIRSDLPLPSPEEEIRSTFASVKDWGMLYENVDTLSIYTQLRPVIQQGPQCGIVALSMASQVFPETVDVADLLEAAKKQSCSCHGEMFSSDAMSKLAESINGMEATVRRDILCNPRNMLEVLMQGDLILVPYDAERNYMPGLRGGHKAHWGIICGCLVQCQSLNIHMGGASKLDSHVDHLWHLRPRSKVGVTYSAKNRDGSVTPSTPVVPGSPIIRRRPLRTPELPAASPINEDFKISETSRREGSLSRGSEMDTWSINNSRVNTPMLPDFLQDEIKLVALWRQGKSRKLVAAPLEQLCESNDQLLEYPPASTPSELEYIIGSVQDGLAGQVVVLHKTKTALSDLVGILQEKKSC